MIKRRHTSEAAMAPPPAVGSTDRSEGRKPLCHEGIGVLRSAAGRVAAAEEGARAPAVSAAVASASAAEPVELSMSRSVPGVAAVGEGVGGEPAFSGTLSSESALSLAFWADEDVDPPPSRHSRVVKGIFGSASVPANRRADSASIISSSAVLTVTALRALLASDVATAGVAPALADSVSVEGSLGSGVAGGCMCCCCCCCWADSIVFNHSSKLRRLSGPVGSSSGGPALPPVDGSEPPIP
jgi:hypothetical protein